MGNTRKLIVDVQILQTPALERGMGQYISSLLVRFNKMATQNLDIILLYSSLNKNNQRKLNQLFDQLDNCTKVSLPLLDVHATNNTERAMQKNKEILNQWIESNGHVGGAFLLGSLFQMEIYPVFPTGVQRLAIIYDVIPIQLFNKYKSRMKWEDYLTRFSQLYEADNLLCISKTTANDLQIYCSVEPSKLSVINGGPGELRTEKEPKEKPG